MSFDIAAYKEGLNKKIKERYSLREVDPSTVSQNDLGLGDASNATPAQTPASTAPVQPEAPKAKDPEISMEVLRGTVQWALGEKDSGKPSDEIINQLGAMKKPGLIDFIHSYLQGSGQNAPVASQTPAPEVQQATGEPGAEDLSGLTQPEQPQQEPSQEKPKDEPVL